MADDQLTGARNVSGDKGQDRTHALIDLPTNLTIEQVIHLFKGSSSHWISQT